MSGPGRPKDSATDDRIREIAAELEGLGVDATNARIALVLTWERKAVITPNAVKCRRRNMEKG